MGSGKSKTAEILAKIFKYKLFDTDLIVEQKVGRKISSIFEIEGQEFFREEERLALHSVLSEKNCVVATGGGTAVYFDNMEWMNQNGITVYLEANAGLLFHRLATSRGSRPLVDNLNDVEMMEQITGHLAIRIPVYRKAAIIVQAASINVRELGEKIKRFAKSK